MAVWLSDERRSKAIPGLIIWLALLTIFEILLLVVESTCHTRRRCCGSSSASMSGSVYNKKNGTPSGSAFFVDNRGYSDRPAEQFFLNPAHIFSDINTGPVGSPPDDENHQYANEHRRRPISNEAYQSMQTFGDITDRAPQGQQHRRRAPNPPPRPRQSITGEMMIE